MQISKPSLCDILSRAKELTKSYDKCSMLERKAIDIVKCLDFEPQELKYQGKTYYILYDIQTKRYRGSSDCKDFSQYLEFASNDIAGLTTILSEPFFDDYGFDCEKVFDDRILSYADCYFEKVEAI